MLVNEISVDSIIPDTTELLSDRGDAMLILTIILAMGGLWVWKVVIPERAARRDQDTLREAARLETEKLHSETLAKQADTIAALGQVTATIHDTTTHTHNNTTVLLQAVSLQVDCAEKLSQHVGCDSVRDSLSELRGLIKAANARNR